MERSADVLLAIRERGPVSRTDDQPDGGMSSNADRVSVELQRVCDTATVSLSASGAGLSVMADSGVQGMAIASDPATERVEELQFTLGEGPCVDAFALRRPVLIPDLVKTAMRRWPIYAPCAHDIGVRAVFAFPLQVGAARLGVLDVFRTRSSPLSPWELSKALVLAERAVTTLLDGQERATDHAPADGLDDVIERRAELFQAQGIVMVQLGSTLAEAMSRIRAYSFAEDRRLYEVATDIIANTLRFDQDQP